MVFFAVMMWAQRPIENCCISRTASTARWWSCPRDMDGVPIRVGDVLHDCEGDDDMRVDALRFNGQWEIRSDYGYTMPRWCVHKRPDSFGRIADDIEAAEDWCDQNGDYGTGITSVSEETLRGWADRIRKIAKEDE